MIEMIQKWLSPIGRISRGTFWRSYVVPLSLVGVVAAFGDYSRDQFEHFYLFGFYILLSFWPVSVAFIKRMHDCDVSTPWALAYMGLLLGFQYGLLPADPRGSMTEVLGMLGYLAVFLYWIRLAFFRGTRGENRFGPDPVGASGAS